RRDTCPVDKHGRRQAGAHDLAVDQDAARAAHPDAAAFFRASQLEIVAQQMQQQAVRRHADRARHAVQLERQGVLAHASRVRVVRGTRSCTYTRMQITPRTLAGVTTTIAAGVVLSACASGTPGSAPTSQAVATQAAPTIQAVATSVAVGATQA